MKPSSPYESLLSEPGSIDHTKKLERPTGPTVNISNEFLPSTYRNKEDGASRNFSRQYAHAYAVRLWATRPVLEEEIKKEWKGTVVKKIAGLCESASTIYSTSGTGDPSSTKESKNSPVKGSKRKSDDHEQHLAMREDIVVGELTFQYFNFGHFIYLYYR
jgi:hypothetical protein